METSPVFIVGAPRSGTTLLQLMLASHSNFYSLPETHFFTYIVPNISIKSLYSNNFFEHFFNLLETKPKIFFSEKEREAVIENVSQDISIKKLLEAIVVQHKEKNNLTGTRWIEKTPRHVNHLDDIFSYWSDAKVINIFRDPRDSISSFHSKYHFSNRIANFIDIYRRIKKYKTCISSRNECKSKNISDIFYEELVGNPQEQLKTVMNFLEDEFEDVQIEEFSAVYKSSVAPGENHKRMAQAGKIIDRRHVWKERLDSDELWLIEKTCKEEMELLGYDRMSVNLPVIQKIELIGFYVMYLTNVLLIYLGRSISKILPQGIRESVKEFIRE
jgi:hypothetical protein